MLELQHSRLAAEQHAATAPSTFRFEDLPEELQAQIVSACLPDWSYTISKLSYPSCMSFAHHGYTCYRTAHQPQAKSQSSTHKERLWTLTSLRLVNRHLDCLVEDRILQKFTGCLYVDLSLRSITCEFLGYGNCPECSSDILGGYDNVSKSVTIMYDADASLIGFNLNLLSMLPRLKVAVTRCDGTLFDGNIYGFGEEKFFIRVVSEEKLRELMLAKLSGWNASARQKLEYLWEIGIRTVVEMTVAMGSPPMKFEFVCVFLLRKQADIVVLGKFATHEWEASTRLRKLVYTKSVESEQETL